MRFHCNMKRNSIRLSPPILPRGSVAPVAATAAACLVLSVCPLASSSVVLPSAASGHHEGDKPQSSVSPAVSAGWVADGDSHADKMTTWLLLVPSILGLAWAMYEAWKVSQVRLDGPLVDDTKRLTDPLQLEVRNRKTRGQDFMENRSVASLWEQTFALGQTSSPRSTRLSGAFLFARSPSTTET